MVVDNKPIQMLNKINLKTQKRLKVKNPRMRRFCNALRNHPRKEYLLDFLDISSKELIPYQLLEMAFEMLTDDYDDIMRTRWGDGKLQLPPWEDKCDFWKSILMRKVFLDTSFQKRESTLSVERFQLWRNFYNYQYLLEENDEKSERTIQDNLKDLISANVFNGIFYLAYKEESDYIATFYPKLTMLLINNMKKSPFTKYKSLSSSYDLNVAFYKKLVSNYLTSDDKNSSSQEESPFLKAEALNYLEGICNTYTKLNFFHMALEKNIYTAKGKKEERSKYIQETMDTILSQYSSIAHRELFRSYLMDIYEKEKVREFHYFFNNQFLLLGYNLYERFLSYYSKLLENYYFILHKGFNEKFFFDLEKSFEVIDKKWPSALELINGISPPPKIYPTIRKLKTLFLKKLFIFQSDTSGE